MKNRRILALGSIAYVAATFTPQVHATDLYWDADGAGAALGGTGLWNTASALWRLDTPAGALQTYNNATPSPVIARFEGTAGTVTIPDVINAAGLTFGTGVTGYNVTTGAAAKMNAAVPAAGTFTVTTNGGANTLSADFLFPNANITFVKTGPGTLFYPTGAGTSPNRGIYTVTGGTFDPQTLLFDSIFSMAAGNRLGTTGGANPAIPQLTLDAGTLQLTQTGGNNNLADSRGVQVTVNGGAIQDGGSEAQIPSYIKNASGPSTGLYLSNISGRTRFMGVISGVGNLTWTGTSAGNLAGFENVNTYSGTTTINTGTIRLDFAASNTGTTRLNSATAVTLNSGTLAMVGTTAAAQTSTQSVSGVTVSGPFAGLSNSGTAGLTSTLNLGPLTRTGLGTVNITLAGSGVITTPTANGASGILGGWATIGSNWASSAGNGVTPGNITAYTGYLTTTVAGNTAANYLATSNVDVTSSPVLTGPVTINTLRFNTAGANTVTLTGANIISGGGLLVGTGVGANTSAITGGSLAGSADGYLSVTQNNTNPLTISSQILNNVAPTTLLKGGTGNLTLSGGNSYSGGTQLAGGTIGVGDSGALGSGDLTFFNSGTLLATANVNLPNNIKLGITSDVFDAGANTLTLSGAVTGANTGGTPFKAQGTGTIVLAGTFDLTGTAGNTDLPAIMLGNRNGANFNRGTLNITGTGSISRISTGWDNTANVLNIASSGTINMATDLVSGQSANGFGAVNVSSGTINMQNLNLANWDGANGSFTMTGGTLNTVNVRNGGTGNGSGNSYSRFTGGTVNVASFSTMSRQGNGTNILHVAGAGAQYNVGPGNFFFGFSPDSTGILTVDAGSVTAEVNMQLTNGNTANTYGIINLNGGVLSPNGIGTGGALGKSIVNFDGGLLRARVTNANFLGGLTQANIYDGGARIDTNGATVTIAQALQPATGNGITAIPVTTGGTGYLGIPVVKITGGGPAASGATAVAIVSGGVVTGIQITSPGTGYTTAPTVTLTAAGALTSATLGTATFAANAADGGLVKEGDGSLRLSGNNTYTGPTIVNGGFLQAGFATNAFGINSALTLADATGVLVDFNNLNVTIGSLTGGGGLGGDIILGTSILTVGTDNTSPAAYAGAITGAGGLIKTGTGTLALSGNNFFTGDSQVNNGTLNLTSEGHLGFLVDDLGTTTVAVGATGTAVFDGIFNIDLSAVTLENASWNLVTKAPGGTVTYGPNFSPGLDWTEGTPGVWTISDGEKTFTFTEASGVLIVGNGGNNYASWIDGFFPGETDPLIVGPGADPDNDGIRNAVEMVIGGDPKLGMDTALMPTVELVVNPAGVPAGSYMLVTYRRSDLSVAAGLVPAVESNTVLTGTWTTAVDGVSGVEILEDDNYASFTPPAADTDRVRVYIPRGANPTLFGRLNVKVP